MIIRKMLVMACTTIMMANAVFGQGAYHLAKKINLDGEGKWDYLQVDEKSKRLFVSHFDRVHVIDMKNEREVKSINNLQGVHGIALAPEFNKGFISNGTGNSITVFNYATLDSITTIHIKGEKPDAIMYDPYSRKVWVFCGKTNNAVVIDPSNNNIVNTVMIGEAPEFAVSNNKGIIYNNLEDGNAVVMIDADKKKVVKRFPLQDKAAPTGLAIDLVNNVLFSACAETKQMTVLDAATGKIIGNFPISSHVDAVAFDPARKLVFCSGGDGVITTFKQIDKIHYEAAGEIVTQAGAKTMALDNNSHKLYTSTANYEADQKTLVKGSFNVLIFDYK